MTVRPPHSDEGMLDRPLAFTNRAFRKRREQIQQSGKPIRLDPDDELLHFLAQYLLDESGSSRSRRQELEEGQVLDRNLTVRESMSVLHRQQQLDLDSWVCKVCGYVNARDSKVLPWRG